MSSIFIVGCFRWKAYPLLLVTQLQRKICVNCAVKLEMKLVKGIHNPAISLKRKNLEQFSNQQQEGRPENTMLCDLEPTVLELSQNTKTFINKSLCPYNRGVWRKCKKLTGKYLIHQYYTTSNTARANVKENGSTRSITAHVFNWSNFSKRLTTLKVCF